MISEIADLVKDQEGFTLFGLEFEKFHLPGARHNLSYPIYEELKKYCPNLKHMSMLIKSTASGHEPSWRSVYPEFSEQIITLQLIYSDGDDTQAGIDMIQDKIGKPKHIYRACILNDISIEKNCLGEPDFFGTILLRYDKEMLGDNSRQRFIVR